MNRRGQIYVLSGLAGLLFVFYVYLIDVRSNTTGIRTWINSQLNKSSFRSGNEDAFAEELIAVSDGTSLCDCPPRLVTASPAPPGVTSTCNDAATARGQHQKVVAFNFFGNVNNVRQYYPGIERNALLMPSSYPGWVMRVYHDLPPHYPALCELSCKFPFLDFCDARNVSGFGNMMSKQRNAWRFMVMADPLVDMFVSRDLDSGFTDRELRAVDEWLESNLTFHVMRDSNWHVDKPILAGMWGARLNHRRGELRNISRIVTGADHGRVFNMDQQMIWQHLWPAMKDDVLQHDSYGCFRYASFGNMRPFPTRRNETVIDNWVGTRLHKDLRPKIIECPEECRPEEHKDWIYC